MYRDFLRKSLFAVITLLLVLSFGDSALATDYHARINEVTVDMEGETIFIVGSEFETDCPPVVLLGANTTPLTLLGNNIAEITVVLPDVPNGDYLLQVGFPGDCYDPDDDDDDDKDKDKHDDKLKYYTYDLTIGAGGQIDHQWTGTALSFQNPDGSWGQSTELKGETGAQGPQGIQGQKGDKGGQGPIGPQGVGIQGPKGDKGDQGKQGLPGKDGTIIKAAACPPGQGVTGITNLGSLTCAPIGAQLADNDNDGFTVANGDCHDENPDVNPGAQGFKDTPYKMMNGATTYDWNCDGKEERSHGHELEVVQRCRSGWARLHGVPDCGGTGKYWNHKGRYTGAYTECTQSTSQTITVRCR